MTVTLKNRTKRKIIATITGLDNFGVKLKSASKALSKKFACSASVSTNGEGKKEIVMQGNISYELPSVIGDLYKVQVCEHVYRVCGKTSGQMCVCVIILKCIFQ